MGFYEGESAHERQALVGDGPLYAGAMLAARFHPRQVDDLVPGGVKLIGAFGLFEAMWRIEDDEPYAGEWAMKVPENWPIDAVWVPEGDLMRVSDCKSASVRIS